MAGLGRIFRSTLQAVAAAVLIRDHVVEAAFCTGESMEPTIRSHGDVILVNKMARRFRRGDITVCISPQDAGRLICKRIVATEHDELIVEGATDKLYGGLGRTRSFVRVPRGHVWLEGDNQERSHDSRHFGAVPVGLVQGRAVCKIWPLRDFGRPLH